MNVVVVIVILKEVFHKISNYLDLQNQNHRRYEETYMRLREIIFGTPDAIKVFDRNVLKEVGLRLYFSVIILSVLEHLPVIFYDQPIISSIKRLLKCKVKIYKKGPVFQVTTPKPVEMLT